MNKIKNIIKTACVMLMAVSNAPGMNSAINAGALVGPTNPSNTTAQVTSMNDLQFQLANEVNNYLRSFQVNYGCGGTEARQEALALNIRFTPFNQRVKNLSTMLVEDYGLSGLDGHDDTIAREPLKELGRIIKTIIDNGGESKHNRLNKLTEEQSHIMLFIIACMNLIGGEHQHNKHELIKHIVEWVRDKSGKSDDEFNMMCGDIPETARALHDTLGISKLFAAIPQAQSDTASFLTFLSTCSTVIEAEELAVEQIFHMFTDMLAKNQASLT